MGIAATVETRNWKMGQLKMKNNIKQAKLLLFTVVPQLRTADK